MKQLIRKNTVTKRVHITEDEIWKLLESGGFTDGVPMLNQQTAFEFAEDGGLIVEISGEEVLS